MQMYSSATSSSFGCTPPQCNVFQSACQNVGVSAFASTPAAMRQQQVEMQQQPQQQCTSQQQQQRCHNGKHPRAEGQGEGPASNSAPRRPSPVVNSSRQPHVHRWNPPVHCKQINKNQNEHTAMNSSPKRIPKEGPHTSPVTATEKPGLLTRLLRPGRSAEKRSHSSTQGDRHGEQHHPEAATITKGRSLTPPASTFTFGKTKPTDAAYVSKEKCESPVSRSGPPRQKSPLHWLHHQRGRKPEHHQQQPHQQQQQQQQLTPGSHHVVQGPSCRSRKSSPFASATCSVPLKESQLVDRGPRAVVAAFPVPGEAPCMAEQVFSAGLPVCPHGVVRVGHSALPVTRDTCPFSQQHHYKQIFFAPNEASRGLGGNFNSNTRYIRRLLPSYLPENASLAAVPSSHYGKRPAFSNIPVRSPFNMCSPMLGCFPAPHLFAENNVSEASTAASCFQLTQTATLQSAPSTACAAGGIVSRPGTGTSSALRKAPGGHGKAIIDLKAVSTFNVNCFFTQLYLLDSAKRLEIIAARISHSMQARAFSYWVVKHRYSIAKHIWDKKVAKEIEHLRRLRNNIERSRQNYAAETARKRAEAEVGTLDKSAELLIIQEQQGEALAQQQAVADEQLERVQRYKTRRGAVLGSLLLAHGLKRLLYEYQTSSLLALRSNLLTDNDILQHTVRMLPKFVPPSWKKLDPTRQAELLRNEYAHLVDPATIHLTNLREMYRLHRLDLEARSRRLGRYYRRFFAWTRSFTILGCIQRSQKRRLLCDAYTMLRYYTWTIRAIEGESLACNATIAHLREGTKPRSPAFHTRENSSSPLRLPFYPRHRRYTCNGCFAKIPAKCCCGSNLTTSVTCRQHNCCCPLSRGGACEEEEATAARTGTVSGRALPSGGAAVVSGTAIGTTLQTQSDVDTSVQQSLHTLSRPRKACSAVVTDRDEMSGIFFPRYRDGPPMPRLRSAGRDIDNSNSMQQNCKTACTDATGNAGDGSGRDSPREKYGFCNTSSLAVIQVTSSCCCHPQQKAAFGCSSNATGLPSRATILSTEMFLPAPSAIVPAPPCVALRSSPETAEQDAAIVTSGTTAGIHRCTDGRTEEEEGLISDPGETRWTYTPSKHITSSSRCLSPVCRAREEHHSPRPCLVHQTDNAQILPVEAGQHHNHRQKPEIHKSCFTEASAPPTHRVPQRVCSGTGLCTPKAIPHAGTTQSSSWKRRSAQTTPRQKYQQESQGLAGRNDDAACLQENIATYVDGQGTPSRFAHGTAEGSATPGAAVRRTSGFATGQRANASSSFSRSAAPQQQASAYVTSDSNERNPCVPMGLPTPLSVFAGNNSCSANDNAVAESFPSAVAAGSALPFAATRNTFAMQEAERNAALILGLEPRLRSHTDMRAVPMKPVTITFKPEKRSIWDDPPKPGEIPEKEEIHVIGRNWSSK